MSKDFNLARMTTTSSGFTNVPNDAEIDKLRWLWDNLVCPIEDMLGQIAITSAFRSPEVNKAIGGVPTSQHPLAEAVDFIPKDVTLEDAFTWCKSSLEFGQLIIEESHPNGGVTDHGVKRWIHISRPRTDKPNQVALRMIDGKYTVA